MVCEHRWVANDATVCVARDVGPPFPGAGVRVAGSNVLGLQAFEFLLGAEFVGLLKRVSGILRRASGTVNIPSWDFAP